MPNELNSSLTVGELRVWLAAWPDEASIAVTAPDGDPRSLASVLRVVAAGQGSEVEGSGGERLSALFPLTAVPDGEVGSPGDDWGIPDILLGPLSDDFFGALGRVAALSALLEDRLRVLLQAVRHVSQAAHAKDSPGRFIPELRRQTGRLESEWDSFALYLDDVSELLERRNLLLHSIWQPEPDGFFGHRLDWNADRVTSATTIDAVREDISHLARLINEWQRWFALAGSIPWPVEGQS